jgi:hypothetical protein
MLRRSVIALFVVGVLASIASVPTTFESGTGGADSNQVVLPIDLDPSQRRVRLRVRLDVSSVFAEGPTNARLSLAATAGFDDVASAVPARVRLGLLAPDEVDTVDIALLTFVRPDETYQLEREGEYVADVLLVREDEGEGVVALTLTFDASFEADRVTFSTGPVLTVEQLPDDSA